MQLRQKRRPYIASYLLVYHYDCDKSSEGKGQDANRSKLASLGSRKNSLHAVMFEQDLNMDYELTRHRGKGVF